MGATGTSTLAGADRAKMKADENVQTLLTEVLRCCDSILEALGGTGGGRGDVVLGVGGDINTVGMGGDAVRDNVGIGDDGVDIAMLDIDADVILASDVTGGILTSTGAVTTHQVTHGNVLTTTSQVVEAEPNHGRLERDGEDSVLNDVSMQKSAQGMVDLGDGQGRLNGGAGGLGRAESGGHRGTLDGSVDGNNRATKASATPLTVQIDKWLGVAGNGMRNPNDDGRTDKAGGYNFSKIAQYKQLTLEEAEEKMNKRKTSATGYERWMMKAATNGPAAFGSDVKKLEATNGTEKESARPKKGKNNEEGNNSDKGEEDEEEEGARKNWLGLNKKSMDDDEEGGKDLEFDLDDEIEKGDDWEHEETFTDDDEAVDIDPEERADLAPEIPAPPEIKQDDEENEEEGGLSKSGKELKKLLGRAAGLNESDAEEEDEDDDVITYCLGTLIVLFLSCIRIVHFCQKACYFL
ncbi:hypothetical protein GUJ93_ZPchr0010g10192 [Zizania palustris]|uniref:Transcription initiation factor IIF subunit alpha n=1 Tax=Zizania palustris TaxID=103762 RepID=A0A8J6BJ50_ZIZPA|nr:hypothetical protein GUJ93_ZPchr0010g10192 [Zizania palustris]